MIHEVTTQARARNLVEAAGEPLKASGFKKRGDVYTRAKGSVLQMIDVQYSGWNSPEEISFTMNCGVYVPGVTAIFRNTREPKQPKPTDCCVAARVGMLTAHKLDLWWKVSIDDNPTADEEKLTEVRSIIHQSAVPFLDRFPDEAAVRTFLSQPRGPDDEYVEPRAEGLRFAYAAVLWSLLGRQDECKQCMALAVMRSSRTPLAEVILAFEKRFGCGSSPTGA